MSISTGFSYLQARLQARHGQRPADGHWQQLESCDSTHAYLEAARSGPLARWAERLSSRDDTHRLEATVREAWMSYVRRVASWSPLDWRDAVARCGDLTLVPVAAHLARDGETREWIEALSPAENSPASTGDWRASWLASTPPVASRERRGLERLQREVERWVAANRDPDNHSITRADALRTELEERVTALFRREARQPAAIFAHLVLTALDVQRFRGGLLRRHALSGAS